MRNTASSPIRPVARPRYNIQRAVVRARPRWPNRLSRRSPPNPPRRPLAPGGRGPPPRHTHAHVPPLPRTSPRSRSRRFRRTGSSTPTTASWASSSSAAPTSPSSPSAPSRGPPPTSGCAAAAAAAAHAPSSLPPNPTAVVRARGRTRAGEKRGGGGRRTGAGWRRIPMKLSCDKKSIQDNGPSRVTIFL